MELKLLSCPLCLKPHFDGVDSLRTSLISAANSKISCPVCNELLMGLDKLTIHLFSHINSSLIQDSINQRVEQKEVPILSQPAILEQQHIPPQTNSLVHTMEAEPVNFVVPPNILSPILELPQEKRIVAEEEKNLRCDICNFCFYDENILEMHQKLLHQTQPDQTTGQCSYHCHLCSKKFRMRGSLMVHLRVAHYGFGHQESTDYDVKADVKCNSGQIDGTSNSYESTEKGSENKHWSCDVCSKLFTTKYFLKKHKRLHTGEMPYFCAQCNKPFTFQQSYHKHMLYHSSEKPHVCGECGRAFKELSTLHNHERIHSGERPFACETCGKCFRQRVSYLVHRRIHTGVMPYKCTACDKSFRYKVSQKSHKCPMNPPGSVVRAPMLVEKLLQKNHNNADKSLDGLASIAVDASRNVLMGADVNSIIFDSNGQIIGQNFTFNRQHIVGVNPKILDSDHLAKNIIKESLTNDNPKNSLGVSNKCIITGRVFSDDHETLSSSLSEQGNPDFFSMVLSPALPDVQALYLSSPMNEVQDDAQVKPTLDTINEESFKKLLYGHAE